LAEAAQLDRDFELTWSPNMSYEPEVALFAQENDNNIYLMLMAIPPKNDVFKKSDRARELIFIIDSSGSMSGGSMVQAKDSLYEALERLKPTDRFNIIDFDSDFEPLYDSAQMATKINLNYAKRFIRKIDADGGTEMYKPIDFALKSRDSESKNYLRQIVFITDGQSSNEESIFNNVSYNIKNDRFFTIGIGSAPNSYLLTKLADFGRGAFTFIGSQAAVSQKMNRLFEMLESPALTDIQVNFPPEITSELAKDVIHDLYAGETITAAFKMNALPDSLEITGKTIDGTFNKTITIDKLSDSSGIDILWARRKIDRLTDFYNNTYAQSNKDSAQRVITDLALDYHLVSRFTSLVAVDITPSRPEHEELITQAIIKKAKADGLEKEIELNEDGQLQNRDELMLALMKALPKDRVKDASAQKQFEMVMKSANVPPSAFASMKVPDKIAALVDTPVKLIPSSQTATYSELLMYIGLSLLLIAVILRRRLTL
jgi:Ca-activated chloride channel family protein